MIDEKQKTNKELILKHLRKNGEKGTQFKELQQVLPSHSRRQIQMILNDLRNEGKIFLAGKTSRAEWHITI